MMEISEFPYSSAHTLM